MHTTSRILYKYTAAKHILSKLVTIKNIYLAFRNSIQANISNSLVHLNHRYNKLTLRNFKFYKSSKFEIFSFDYSGNIYRHMKQSFKSIYL
jgi:hypothetical protein